MHWWYFPPKCCCCCNTKKNTSINQDERIECYNPLPQCNECMNNTKKRRVINDAAYLISTAASMCLPKSEQYSYIRLRCMQLRDVRIIMIS